MDYILPRPWSSINWRVRVRGIADRQSPYAAEYLASTPIRETHDLFWNGFRCLQWINHLWLQSVFSTSLSG